MVRSPLIEVMTRAAMKAARGLRRDYNEVEHLQVSKKGPANFVSNADLRAEKTLHAELSRARPKFGFLMEEGGEIKGEDPEFRWIVDPLDGTKEFINRRGEFTVNIALIERGLPIRGVVYAPAIGRLFATRASSAVELQVKDHRIVAGSAKALKVTEPDNTALTVIASTSHRDQATDDYIAKFNVANFTSAGSSLKFCLLAAGEADFYPRLGRTMEWDTAAGHAILAAAGGIVLRFDDHETLGYGKAGWENPFFLAMAPDIQLRPAGA